MLFQVIDSGGTPVMKTEYISCIPEENLLKSMMKAGYKFKIDGKSASLKKIKEIKDGVC